MCCTDIFNTFERLAIDEKKRQKSDGRENKREKEGCEIRKK
jgi:hypothetical protein